MRTQARDRPALFIRMPQVGRTPNAPARSGRNPMGRPPLLLGGRTERKTASGGYLDGPMESWAPDLDVVNRIIQFALTTGRLE